MIPILSLYIRRGADAATNDHVRSTQIFSRVLDVVGGRLRPRRLIPLSQVSQYVV